MALELFFFFFNSYTTPCLTGFHFISYLVHVCVVFSFILFTSLGEERPLVYILAFHRCIYTTATIIIIVDTLFFTVSWLGYDIPLRCLQYFPLVFKLEDFYETPYCHLSFKLFSFILNCYTVLYNVYKLTHQQNILYLYVITTDQTMFVGVVRYEYQFFLV